MNERIVYQKGNGKSVAEKTQRKGDAIIISFSLLCVFIPIVTYLAYAIWLVVWAINQH